MKASKIIISIIFSFVVTKLYPIETIVISDVLSNLTQYSELDESELNSLIERLQKAEIVLNCQEVTPSEQVFCNNIKDTILSLIDLRSYLNNLYENDPTKLKFDQFIQLKQNLKNTDSIIFKIRNCFTDLDQISTTKNNNPNTTIDPLQAQQQQQIIMNLMAQMEQANLMIEKFSRPRKWKNTKFWLYVGGGVIGAIVLTSLIVYVYNFGVGPLCELLGRPCAGLNSQVDEKREENQKTVTIMKDNTEDIKKSINSLQKDIGKQRKALNLALKKFETMLTTDLPKMKNQIADRIILSKLIQKNIDLSRNLQKRLLNVEKAVIELKAKDITLAQLIKTGRRKFKSIDDDIDNLKEGIFAAQLSTLENKYRFVNKVVEINKFLPENKQISLKQPRPAIKQRVRFKDPQTKDKK